MATAIAGPLIAMGMPPTVYSVVPTVAMVFVRKPMSNWVPIVFRMVPMSREQNRPCAMAPRASIPYRRREISMSLRFRNALTFSQNVRFVAVFSMGHYSIS